MNFVKVFLFVLLEANIHLIVVHPINSSTAIANLLNKELFRTLIVIYDENNMDFLEELSPVLQSFPKYLILKHSKVTKYKASIFAAQSYFLLILAKKMTLEQISLIFAENRFFALFPIMIIIDHLQSRYFWLIYDYFANYLRQYRISIIVVRKNDILFFVTDPFDKKRFILKFLATNETDHFQLNNANIYEAAYGDKVKDMKKSFLNCSINLSGGSVRNASRTLSENKTEYGLVGYDISVAELFADFLNATLYLHIEDTVMDRGYYYNDTAIAYFNQPIPVKQPIKHFYYTLVMKRHIKHRIHLQAFGIFDMTDNLFVYKSYIPLFPHEQEDLVFLVPSQIEKNTKQSIWFSYFNLTVLSLWLGVAVIFTLLRQFCQKLLKLNQTYSFETMYFETFGLSLGTTSALATTSKTQRFLQLLVSTFAVLASLLFTGFLFQENIHTNQIAEIQTVKELMESRIHLASLSLFQYNLLDNPTVAQYYKSEDEFYLFNNNFYLFKNVFCQNFSFAYLFQEKYADLVIDYQQKHFTNNKTRYFYKLKEKVNTIHTGFEVAGIYPFYEREKFGIFLFRIMENGVLKFLKTKSNRELSIGVDRMTDTVSLSDVKPIIFKDLYVAFFVLCVGLSAGAIVFVIEQFLYIYLTYGNRVEVL